MSVLTGRFISRLLVQPPLNMRKAIDLCIFLRGLVQVVEYVVREVPRHQPLDCLQASTHRGTVQHGSTHGVPGVEVTTAISESLQDSDVSS